MLTDFYFYLLPCMSFSSLETHNLAVTLEVHITELLKTLVLVLVTGLEAVVWNRNTGYTQH